MQIDKDEKHFAKSVVIAGNPVIINVPRKFWDFYPIDSRARVVLGKEEFTKRVRLTSGGRQRTITVPFEERRAFPPNSKVKIYPQSEEFVERTLKKKRTNN